MWAIRRCAGRSWIGHAAGATGELLPFWYFWKEKWSECMIFLHDSMYLNRPIELKEHQVEGVAWLQSLFRENLNGCLLADDMGLGKTLQLLYFIE